MSSALVTGICILGRVVRWATVESLAREPPEANKLAVEGLGSGSTGVPPLASLSFNTGFMKDQSIAWRVPRVRLLKLNFV